MGDGAWAWALCLPPVPACSPAPLGCGCGPGRRRCFTCPPYLHVTQPPSAAGRPDPGKVALLSISAGGDDLERAKVTF